MTELFQTFLANLYDTSLIEGIAVFFGILSVWYARKENILVYPTGIVSVLLYVYICIEGKIYADAGINVFYFLMSVYGWYSWTHQDGKQAERQISMTTYREKIYISIGLIIFYAILYYVLKNYIDSDVAPIDAATTSIFIIGMWLMALKKIENWSFWIAGNIISIPLYTYKGLVLSSLQFLIFLILAIMGLIEWRKRLSSN